MVHPNPDIKINGTSRNWSTVLLLKEIMLSSKLQYIFFKGKERWKKSTACSMLHLSGQGRGKKYLCYMQYIGTYVYVSLYF